MPVGSLIVRTKAQDTHDVVHHLEKLDGITVSDVHQEKVIVLTETDGRSEDKELWNTLENIKGVVQCDLIYYNFEDEEEQND